MNNLIQDTQSAGRILKSRPHKYGIVEIQSLYRNYMIGMNRRS